MSEGKFFIVNEDSSDTAPRHIYFTLAEAVDDGPEYIDVFNKDGLRTEFYVLEDGEYTQNAV